MTAKYRPPSMMSAFRIDDNIHGIVRKELERLILSVGSSADYSVEINIISRELVRLNQVIHNKHSFKDVLVIIKLLGELPYSALSCDDFACIARFVTRTSKEKQLSIFESPEIQGVCILLLLFLKHEGRGCRRGSELDMIHEVLRAVAQLILLSPQAMQPYRLETIPLFLYYARDATPDALNLVPALDGLCNLLLTFSRDTTLIPNDIKLLPSIDAVTVTDADNNSKDPTRLLEECVELGLLFNLRNALVRFHDAPDPTQRYRWLVSGLRALTAALTLASTTLRDPKLVTSASTPVKANQALTSGTSSGFTLSTGSALNALNNSVTLFGGILGRVDISNSNNSINGASSSQCAMDMRVKLWKHAILFLTALSTYNSAADMKTWLLHLGDSLVVDARWKALSKVGNASSRGPVSVSEYRSHLFRCASSSPHAAIRAAAVDCLHAMLDRPSLRKAVVLAMRLDKNVGGALQIGSQAGSESSSSLVLKVFKVAAMALLAERSEEVVQQLLRIASLFVNNMPLRNASLSDDAPLDTRQQTGGIQAELEGIAGILFRGVMTVATEHQVPSSSGHLAIVWLEQHCKAPVTSQAFAAALEMNYLPLSEPVPAPSTAPQSTDFSPVKRGSASSEGNWRNKSATPSSIESSAVPRSSPPVPLEHSSRNSPCNFLSAAVDMCSACSRGVAGISSAQSVVIRSLCSLLVGGHPRLRGDGQWLEGVLDGYSLSEAPALRVQSCRMVTALLGDSSLDTIRATEIVNNFDTVMLAARRLQATLVALLTASGEADHMVRAAAIGSLGALSAECWLALRQLPASRLDNQIFQLPDRSISIQAAILRTILSALTDPVSTVRSASFKALGDTMLARGLGGSYSLDDDSELIGSVFAATMAPKGGCSDSSLAVRTQAAWALSNMLQSVLPLRFDYLRHLLVVVQCEERMTAPTWLQDDAWRSLFELVMRVLTVDSEKLSATAVRTLGFLVGGLSPRLAPHLELIDRYYHTLRERYLVSEASTAVQALEDQSQKLAFAVSQSLGFLLWGQLTGDVDHNNSADLLRVDEIVTVQVAMLRHGKPALQLQAAQVLLYFVSSLGTADRIPPDSLRYILETVLLVGTIPHKAASGSRARRGPSEGLVAGDVTADEANRLLESRIGSLQRYLLVLLWSALRLATVSFRAHLEGAAFRLQVLSQLDDQSRGLAEWLERLRFTGSRCQLETDLLLGLPHTAYSGNCILLKPLDGKSYSMIVSEAAGSVLDLLQLVERSTDTFSSTEHLLATSAARFEALRDGFSRPSVERSGGYGVFSGLEPVLSPRVSARKEGDEDQDEI